MLVKINKYTKHNVNVTELDIDEFGTIIPIRDLELKILEHNNNLYDLITQSSYAAIFTQKDLNRKDVKDHIHDENSNIILLVNPITIDELNNEKKRVIESTNKAKKNNTSIYNSNIREYLINI
jgi:hypothetical protein